MTVFACLTFRRRLWVNRFLLIWKSAMFVSGPVGTSVSVTGLAFTGATQVTFNGTPATFSVVNDTTITAVVKDAARLLSWGRDWHELPEAIARIAGRPGIAQVRQILRGNRATIEERALQQDKH